MQRSPNTPSRRLVDTFRTDQLALLAAGMVLNPRKVTRPVLRGASRLMDTCFARDA